MLEPAELTKSQRLAIKRRFNIAVNRPNEFRRQLYTRLMLHWLWPLPTVGLFLDMMPGIFGYVERPVGLVIWCVVIVIVMLATLVIGEYVTLEQTNPRHFGYLIFRYAVRPAEPGWLRWIMMLNALVMVTTALATHRPILAAGMTLAFLALATIPAYEEFKARSILARIQGA